MISFIPVECLWSELRPGFTGAFLFWLVAPASGRRSFSLVAQASACALFRSAISKFNSKETSMSSLSPKDRKSLYRFTFVDGRQCRTPRSPGHSHLCSDHARKDSQARAADKLARELSYFFSGNTSPPAISAPPSPPSSPA